jgi:FlaA1/EpsC-like NDP-sugar epimerase
MLDLKQLLGRDPIRVNADRDYLEGKRVMVTGAGGSIGSELCKQIYIETPYLIMLDRDESALHALQLFLESRGLLEDVRIVLADIQDKAGIDRMMQRYQPEVVFHAAAFKHQPLLARYPDQAIRNNVLGTANVLAAAIEHGVQTFVNISTDKAANPTCPLGCSKRITERLTSWAATKTQRQFLSVRFGNVLGSRGSVLDTLRTQQRRGLPFEITDPEVSRFFMLVEEAVGLTIHAGGIGKPGQALVLDMGQPVRIADLARRLDPSRGVVYSGLREGEKLVEGLLGDGEVDCRPEHELIMHVEVPGLDPAMIDIDLDMCTDLGANLYLHNLARR